MNIDNLKNYAENLRDWDKITDALFVENLIAEIEKRDKITITVVDRWLRSAFEFPNDYEKDNCFDTYNRSFYSQIIGNLTN